MNNNNFQYVGFSQYPQQQSDFNQVQMQNGQQMQWNTEQPQMTQPTQITQSTKEPIFYFKPSPTFRGYMAGWCFKTGEHGTGYYMDQYQLKF